MKRSYSTDLTDAEWGYSSPTFPGARRAWTAKDPHRPRDPRRRLLLRPRERMSPEDAAPRVPALGESVHGWFRRWRVDGTWERSNRAIRERLRAKSGRDRHPSAAGVVDPRSAKTTGVGGEARGYDGAGRRCE